MGSFCPVAGNLHLHRYFNFTGSLVETVPKSLHLRAGRNLPDKEFRYLRTVIVTAAVHWGLRSNALVARTSFLKPSSTGQVSAPIRQLSL